MNKVFLIIAILILGSCSSDTKKEEQKTAEEPSDEITLSDAQLKNAGIETGTVVEGTLSTELNLNGFVDVPPQNIVSVSFPLGGYLKSTDLLPGMHVNKGQVIARVEDPALVQLQQDYLMALAKLQFLEKEFERQKLLNENEVNAAKVFQQTQSDYTSQKILVKGLSEKLKLININPARLGENNISRSVAIYSPINGYVSKVNVNIGKYVNPADVLFELINPDDLHAALTVFEKDLQLVHKGQKVKVSFVDEPDKEYDCEVLLVSKNVDDSRGALIHCHFETQPKHLLPGMFLNAKVLVDNVKGFTVPQDAVVRYGETEYLLEATGKNNFKLLPVQTGVKQNNRVTIINKTIDLTDKTIVTKSAYSILSQMMNKAE